MPAATPFSTAANRYTVSADDINSIYGKSNANINSSDNAGRSGSGGMFGSYGALPGYNTPQFQATAYTAPLGPDGLPLYKGLAANLAAGYANIGGQLAQWGQGENAARGTAILAGMDQRIANNRGAADASQGYADAYGDSQRRDLSDLYRQNLARSRQSAMQRGLGNTTIQSNLDRGVNADYARSNMQLEDSLLQNRLGILNQNRQYENQLTGDRLGFLAGIENPYPTYADVSNFGLQGGVLQETGASRG